MGKVTKGILAVISGLAIFFVVFNLAVIILTFILNLIAGIPVIGSLVRLYLFGGSTSAEWTSLWYIAILPMFLTGALMFAAMSKIGGEDEELDVVTYAVTGVIIAVLYLVTAIMGIINNVGVSAVVIDFMLVVFGIVTVIKPHMK